MPRLRKWYRTPKDPTQVFASDGSKDEYSSRIAARSPADNPSRWPICAPSRSGTIVGSPFTENETAG